MAQQREQHSARAQQVGGQHGHHPQLLPGEPDREQQGRAGDRDAMPESRDVQAPYEALFECVARGVPPEGKGRPLGLQHARSFWAGAVSVKPAPLTLRDVPLASGHPGARYNCT